MDRRLRHLLRAKGDDQPSFIKDTDWIKPEGMDLYREIMNGPQNFFKHANRDPEGVLEFTADLVPFVIHDCTRMYRKLTGRMLREGLAFTWWFAFEYPQFLKPGPFTEAVKHAMGEGVHAGGRKTFLALLERPELWPDTD